MHQLVEKIGYDVGGVLWEGKKAPQEGGEDTAFFSKDRWMETPLMEGACETIARLTNERFGSQGSFIVSKAFPNSQRKTLALFAQNRFYDRTGIDPGKVHFCLKRKEKAPICQKLGITVFVDDHLEVLEHLVGIVPTLILFNPDEADEARLPQFQGLVTKVSSWNDLEHLLLP